MRTDPIAAKLRQPAPEFHRFPSIGVRAEDEPGLAVTPGPAAKGKRHRPASADREAPVAPTGSEDLMPTIRELSRSSRFWYRVHVQLNRLYFWKPLRDRRVRGLVRPAHDFAFRRWHGEQDRVFMERAAARKAGR